MHNTNESHHNLDILCLYLRRVVNNISVSDANTLEVAQKFGSWGREVTRRCRAHNGSDLSYLLSDRAGSFEEHEFSDY